MNRKIKIRKKEEKKQEKVVNPKILMITSIVFVVILVGALLFDQIYERTIMTVNGDKYHMDDLSYYFYTVESQYDYFNQMFGGSYWDMTYDETTGETMRDVAKKEAIESALYSEVLYKEAVAEGYTLTADETTTVATNADSLFSKELTTAVIEKYSFTKNYLTDMLAKTTLVARYRQDKIDTLGIDKDEIKAGIVYEDYRQYDIEYLFISTQNTDSEGTSTAKTEEEKAVALEKIKALSASAKTTEDWSTLVPEGETELTYQKSNFLESGTTYSEKFEALMMDMENGAVSDVQEEATGYYIVRMINNNSAASYDSTVAQAINTAENEGFSGIYSKILEKYKYTTNQKAIASLPIGN